MQWLASIEGQHALCPFSSQIFIMLIPQLRRPHSCVVSSLEVVLRCVCSYAMCMMQVADVYLSVLRQLLWTGYAVECKRAHSFCLHHLSRISLTSSSYISQCHYHIRASNSAFNTHVS
jgi:hypothetical protein